MKHKSLAILFGALFAFSACKKDSDTTSEKPITDPLTISASKPGDTLIIRGSNFSEVAAENVVKFNGVDGTVVTATVVSNTGGVTVIELKVVIPNNATTGDVTITVHGNTVTVGGIVITPLTMYVVKGIFTNGTEYQLITLDPDSRSESLVATLGQSAADRISYIAYLSTTNEVMGLNDDGDKLVKINVTTKQKTTTALPASTTTGFAELVVDKNNNLYSVKYDWTDANHYSQSLVKIDPATGNATTIKKFENNKDWESLLFIPASNDVVGVTNEGTRLLKVNLTTKDTSSVFLTGSSNAAYRALVVDNKSNLFAYKGYYPGTANNLAQFVQVNAATGQETLLASLPTVGKINDNILFVPKRNEFISIWDQTGLFKFNATTHAFSNTGLTTVSITYNDLTTN